MVELSQMKTELKDLLTDRGLFCALRYLKDHLPPDSSRYNEVVALFIRLNELDKELLANLMTQERASVLRSQMMKSLLLLIDSLEEADFRQTEGLPVPKVRRGRLLYRVPDTMQLNRPARCVVRIALDDLLLTEGLSPEEAQSPREAICVSKTMKVELMDLSPSGIFDIRSFSEPIQFIRDDDYTQWLFYVTPLQAGTFPLLLKIYLIELVDGQPCKREKVFEKNVEVLATEVVAASVPFQRSAYAFVFDAPLAAGENKEAVVIPISRPARINYVRSIALSMLMIFLAISSFAIYQWVNRELKKPDPEVPKPPNGKPNNPSPDPGLFPLPLFPPVLPEEPERPLHPPWVIPEPIGSALESVKDSLPITPLKSLPKPKDVPRPEPSPRELSLLSGEVSDPAGNNYPTLRFGNLDWMVKNLALPVDGSWCYDNDPGNCVEDDSIIFGRLYTWEAARRACKQLGGGWRLPTLDDCRALARAFGGADNDATDGGHRAFSGLNDHHFNIQFGGYRHSGGLFHHNSPNDKRGYYWVDKERDPSSAWYYLFLTRFEGQVYLRHNYKENAFSCRCVKQAD